MYFTFTHPVYLWYFLFIPFLVLTHFLSLRYAKRKAMVFANFITLKRIAGKKFITRNTPVLLLRVLVFSFLILAASGINLWYPSYVDNNSYVIAIDSSSSMTAKDISPSRIEAAKKYAAVFVDDALPDTKFGVISFSGVTLVHNFITDDKNVVKESLSDITTQKAGGTDIPGAIIAGSNLLLSAPANGRAIILFTDGGSTTGSFSDSLTRVAVDYAVKNHVVVDAIGIGSNSGPVGFLPSYYNISANYDRDFLLRLTNETGGVFLEAKSASELESSLDIIKNLNKNGFVSVHLDMIFLALALIFLFVEWGLINFSFRRLT